MLNPLLDVIQRGQKLCSRPWQKDALRRIVERRGPLNEIDIDELSRMVQKEAGLPAIEAPSPRELLTHETQTEPTEQFVVPTLIRMFGLKNVNALAPNQEIRFSPLGVTVIYGENGAGKTGYSRVLRRACRQWREADAPIILSDVRAKQPPGPPEAQFEFSVARNTQINRWSSEAKIPHLSSFAVFDSSCVEQIVGKENIIAYQPFALTVLDSLGQVWKQVDAKITKIIHQLRAPENSLEKLSALPGVSGEFIRQLGPETDPKRLDVILGDTKVADAELKALEPLVASFGSPNGPEAIARRLSFDSTRIQKCRELLLRALELLNASAIKMLRVASKDRKAARTAADIAAQQQADPLLLPGTGTSDAWRRLYAAARDFSTQQAYRGELFPTSTEAARCLWCQQSLNDEAKRRLAGFTLFIENRTRTELATAENRLKELVSPLANASFDDFEPTLLQLISDRDTDCAEALRGLPAVMRNCRSEILAACESDSWETVGPPSVNEVINRLATIVGMLEQETAMQLSLVDKVQQNMVRDKLLDIRARLSLAQHRDVLLARIRSLNLAQRMTESRGDCSTNALTIENKRQAELILNTALMDRLNVEMDALEVPGHIRVSTKLRGEKGANLSYLILNTGTTPKGGVQAVLSEGEQRVLAVAAFLAEIGLSPVKGGAIFDDPVTSLDHRWSERFAQRIVGFARDRQVVVFTHDLAFFASLESQAIEQRVPFMAQYVARIDGEPGHLTTPPWETMNLGQRLARIESKLARLDSAYAEADSEDEYVALFGQMADLLRQTWERAIEEKLFAKVIERFRPDIQTRRLEDAVIDSELFKLVFDGMSRTSAEIAGHDRAKRRPAQLKSPKWIREELAYLRNFKECVDKKAKVAKAERGALQQAPTSSQATS